MSCVYIADNPLGFENEDELLAYYIAKNDTMQKYYAVVFENLPSNGIPDHLTYKIRLSDIYVQTSLLVPEFIGSGPGISGNIINIGMLHNFIKTVLKILIIYMIF